MHQPVFLFCIFVFLAGVVGCMPVDEATVTVAEPCRFPSEPTVVYAQDHAILQYWQFEDGAVWAQPVLPTDAAYAAYRRQVEEAGADLAQPAQYVPEAEREQEGWQRELYNMERAYSTEAGHLRPVHCLDALLFAYQNARFAQAEQPTEFLASILRKQVDGRTMLRVYFGAGDALFPPKQVYGFDAVERDVAEGWDYVAMLHNHTLQDADGHLRLGVPAPSVSDVQLLRNLVADYGLAAAWITNGFYTLTIPARALDQYHGPA